MSNPTLTPFSDPCVRYLEWMFIRGKHFDFDDAAIKAAYPKADWTSWRDAFHALPDADPRRDLFWAFIGEMTQWTLEQLHFEFAKLSLIATEPEPMLDHTQTIQSCSVDEPDDDQPDNMAIMLEWQEAKRNGEDISLPEFIARKYGNAEPHTTEEPERPDPDVVEPEPNPQPSYTGNAKAKAAPKPSRQRAKAKSGEGFVEGPLHDNLIAMIKKLNTQGKSVDEIEVEFHKYIEAHRAELSDAQANTLFQQAVKVLRGISRVSGVEGALLNPPTPNLRSRYKSAYFLWGHIKSNYSRIGNFAMSDAQASAWAGVSKGANLLEVIKVLTEDVKALKVVDRKQPQKDGGMATEYKRLV